MTVAGRVSPWPHPIRDRTLASVTMQDQQPYGVEHSKPKIWPVGHWVLTIGCGWRIHSQPTKLQDWIVRHWTRTSCRCGGCDSLILSDEG